MTGGPLPPPPRPWTLAERPPRRGPRRALRRARIDDRGRGPRAHHSEPDPERLFEAAAILAAADDDVRRAFADGAAAVPEWSEANRADLETALGLSEPESSRRLRVARGGLLLRDLEPPAEPLRIVNACP